MVETEDAQAAQKSVNEAVSVILLCHSTPEGRKLLAKNSGLQQILQDNLNAILPVITSQIVGRDRQQILQAMQNVYQDRKVRHDIGTEKLNLAAYQAVLHDLETAHTQVRPPKLNLMPAGERPPVSRPVAAPHQVGLSGVTDVAAIEIGAPTG